MEVDHVIPESLLNMPKRLQQVLESLGRPTDFNINSYENWLPACRSCNGKKLATVFEPSLLIQLTLQRAADRAEKAVIVERRTVSKVAIAKALNVLERANDAGELNEESKRLLQPLAAFQEEQRTHDLVGQPIRLTPLFEIISEAEGWRLVRGPYGVGGRPIGSQLHSSFDCHNCGAIAAWNGARCVICGEMNDE